MLTSTLEDLVRSVWEVSSIGSVAWYVLKYHHFSFTLQNHFYKFCFTVNSNHWGMGGAGCVYFNCQKATVYFKPIRKAHCNLNAPWNYFPCQKVWGPHGHAHFEWLDIQARAQNLQNAKLSESPSGKETTRPWVMWEMCKFWPAEIASDNAQRLALQWSSLSFMWMKWERYCHLFLRFTEFSLTKT